MKSFYFLLLILYFEISISTKTISVPFKFKSIERKYLYYRTKTFLDEYFRNELILELNIGTPLSKIDCILNHDSSCFTFVQKELNLLPIIHGYYYPDKSTSFQFNEEGKSPILTNDYKNAQDLFNFTNNENHIINFLLKESNKSKNDNKFLFNKYLPEIGLLNSQKNSCPNLIFDLKNKNIINQNIFTIKYDVNKTKEEGEFIIGEDLFKYDLNYSFNYQYIKIYFKNDFSFEINSIFAEEQTNSKIIINDNITKYYIIDKKREAILNINSGFILGNEDFMNYIEDIYFRQLIEKNICRKDLVKNENENEISEYYIFSCYEITIKGRDGRINHNINYYEKFPKIIFSSKAMGKNFILEKEDLFRLIFNKMYFLIIFKNSNLTQKNENDVWYLGQPFIKKYPFSINYDSKTIGFYFQKEENDFLNNTKNTIKETENNNRLVNVIKYIGVILISFIALYFAYYIGLRARERRRKRANEMKDDDYEYISETNKDVNGDNDNKNQKFLELNTKFGI